MFRNVLSRVIGQGNRELKQLNRLNMATTTRPILTSSPSPAIKAEPEMVDVTFVRADGSKIAAVKGKVGDNLLDVVLNNQVDIDGFGACEGTLSCSTCHLIFKPEDYAKIEQKVTEEEMDMLDLAFGLTETSRLGCQVCLTKKLDGLVVEAPPGVNDAR